MQKINIFNFQDAREYLRQIIVEGKSEKLGLSQNKIASGIGVSPSFLSKFLSHRSKLGEDQYFLLGSVLELNTDEREYLYTLGELDRSSNPERSKYLKSRIEDLQKKKTLTENHIQVQDLNDRLAELRFLYYLYPNYQLTHIAMSIRKYQEYPQYLLQKLKINEKTLFEILYHLESLGLVSKIGEHWVANQKDIHLSKNESVYLAHKSATRAAVLDRIIDREESDMEFSMTFSCSKSDLERIRFLFLETIKRSKEIIKTSKTEEVGHININLFSWL